MSCLATIILLTSFPGVVNADETKGKPADVRDKSFVFHYVPLQVGATPLTERSRYGKDWLHSFQFTACKTAIFRACGVGLTFGYATGRPSVIHNPLDPMDPITISNSVYTLGLSFPVTTRVWTQTESDKHSSFEINLNTSPFYDLRLKRWTLVYGIGATF